ncbi:PadR family transcriptional regulator [Propionibacteriaceae bacterium Y1700]|uniref:PadR family transcriptional regulator n=1 Tax=Microlunatus sp. Y1700 TaxID=3418487 RepID=UPI003DA6DD2C
MSALRHAILGLLARGAHTGYAIAKQMDRPLSYFWQARHSQIYPQLEAMTRDRLIEPTTIPGPGPRPTKEYRLTEAGREVLLAWLISPLPPLQAGRDDFQLRIWSAWLLSRDQVVALVRQRRALVAERLAEYESTMTGVGAGDDLSLDDPLFAEWMSLQAGKGYEEHRLRWCDQMLTRLGANT